MTMHQPLHPRSDVDHPYLPRKLGGSSFPKFKQAAEGEKK